MAFSKGLTTLPSNQHKDKIMQIVGRTTLWVPILLVAAFLNGCSTPMASKKVPPNSNPDGQVGQPEQGDDARNPSGIEVSSIAAPPSDCPLTIPNPAGYQPVALYHLEEGGGAGVLDSSGYGSGVIVDATRGTGACGRGVTLDGPDAHLELSAVGDVFAKGIAVELWIRPASIQPGEVHLIGDGGGGLASVQLTLEDGFPVFRLADSATGGWHELLRSPVPVRASAWQHVRAVYDGYTGDGQLLINGIGVIAANRIMQVAGSYNTIYAGAILGTSFCCAITNQFTGDIDELGIWQK
jgi:hypothetical protein